MISRDIKINILQDAGILKKFFPVSSTPLLVLHVDAEMDMGTVLICRSSSKDVLGKKCTSTDPLSDFYPIRFLN